jgi:hypothetical protein
MWWEIHHLFGQNQSKRKPFSVFFMHLWAFLEAILHKVCDSLTCDNLIENIVWDLWKFAQKFWNSWSALWTRSSGWSTILPLVVNIFSSAHLWPSFAEVMFWAWRKWITARISQHMGLSITRHIITHSVQTRSTLGDQLVIWWLARQWIIIAR